MLDLSPRLAAPPAAVTADTAAALAQAAAALARLDQALAGHPLTPALLHRARLEAVRRHAAVDGFAIDPWHLAALLEGLRLRMDSSLRIIDRGFLFEAPSAGFPSADADGTLASSARHALTQYQWLVTPDFDQEGEIRRAAAALAAAPGHPLLAAAHASHAWLDIGGRPPLRAALIRHWMRHGLLRIPVPLTGAAALRPDTPWDPAAWIPEFLHALAAEAADALQLLLDLERAWLSARRAVAGRRRHSRAPAALDRMAVTPLLSATSLAENLGIAVKNAGVLLAQFGAAGIAVEVTHRGKRRLYGLAGVAPLRAAVAPPYRPQPGRGRGRPPTLAADADAPPPPPPAPLTPLERRAFDTAGLDAAMEFAEAAIRDARRRLETLSSERVALSPADRGGDAGDERADQHRKEGVDRE
jgi:hypothetical protein